MKSYVQNTAIMMSKSAKHDRNQDNKLMTMSTWRRKTKNASKKGGGWSGKRE